MKKIKARVTLDEGESFVVLPLNMFEYLSEVFCKLGQDFPEGSEDRQDWFMLSDMISIQARRNAHKNNVSSYEWDE